MPLNQLWQIYRQSGFQAAKRGPISYPLDYFYLALLAFGEEDYQEAARYARQAAHQAPNQSVFTQAVIYLERILEIGKKEVYASGEGFAAFIRGGNNILLYDKTSQALNTIYQEYQTLSLLDIGVGDGLALLPALSDNIDRLVLIEPSETMLNKTTNKLDERGLPYQAIAETLQDFVLRYEGERWDIIQATYSLQSIPPHERDMMLKWIRGYGRRLLLVEFDVPDFQAMYSPYRVQYIVERYQKGLAEYAHDQGWVAQEFLMPIMFSYFDQTTARTNYEQPIKKWIADLNQAGFKKINSRSLFSYWWATAYLIDAC